MTRKSAQLDEQLHEYLLEHGPRPDALQRELIEDTRRLLPESADMQISPEQASLLTLLAKALRAEYAVEVGTFTGYSALAIARGLSKDGRLLCCDVSTEYTDVARYFWHRAGVSERIELRLAPALRTLRALESDPVIDLSFIDADKTGYIAYWNEIVPRTRPGGFIVVDNVLAGGRVLDERRDETAHAIHEFNRYALRDQRVELTMLPISDGITLARRH
ncbi:caffeoyl-CoA O-methyltransferase [Actinopolyspora xinjiangensis]|uniref:Caffeoyl-CoA O-methyltransferase n=1 Tax=Actinopolyspora xinjiangensis TaxID=405564 RepID=A0A1H0WNK4_9ACTN|nr:O-methyltransferase [Actinopolyspora xinjiangensis]SDP92257.1 caffeoyl-CoA O-methyltransferase [Actinopolyspora xinjiangensis]